MKQIRQLCSFLLIFLLVATILGCNAIDMQSQNKPNSGNATIAEKIGIPKLSSESKLLGQDWEALTIRMGRSLVGPQDRWKNLATSYYYLKDIDSVACYWDSTSQMDVIGSKNEQIVFWGMYGSYKDEYNRTVYTRVKDYLSDESLKTKPYMCNVENGEYAYIWELKNGYLMIITMASSDSN